MSIALPHIARHVPLLRNLRQLIEADETISCGLVQRADISLLVAKSFAASELRLEKVNCSQVRLEKTNFADVEFLNCDVTAASFAEASWRRVLLQDCRGSGMQLPGSTLKDVTFSSCKLDLANFRFAKLHNVRFQDCQLSEADFYAAELRSVEFRHCSLQKTQFSEAKLHQVDLRSSNILGLAGIASLSGAIIDSAQLLGIAPLLAAELKIRVIDD